MDATRHTDLAWRFHVLNWHAVAACGAVFLLCFMCTDFSIEPRSLVRPVGLISIYAVIAYVFVRLRLTQSFGYYAFGSMVQIALVAWFMTPLSYVAAALDLPLQDNSLARLDAMLGLDWVGYFHFLYDRPALIPYGHLGYGVIIWPGFLVALILAASRQFLRLQQFTLACLVTLSITIIISAIVPALGTFQQYGVHYDPAILQPTGYTEQLRQLPQVRSGALRLLDFGKLVGLISFPSFHAAAAILFIWVYWPIWWMRPVVLIANGLMLLATPIFGGHYFVDVFAGIAVAIIAIAVTAAVARRLCHAHERQPLSPFSTKPA